LNEDRYLGQLLDGIRAQTYPHSCVEIIIVDSGSTDGTLEIARKHDCKIVALERSQFSFGRSLNLGCSVAKGSILVFVSGHCVPTSSEWLWELVKPLHDPMVAITYGRQVGGPETKFSEHALLQKYFPDHPANDQSSFFCNNANLALRSGCWVESPFNEALTGLEDMHLARALVQRGYKVVYVPVAAVYHYHHEKWRQVKRRYEREAIALREIMPEVHVHWHDALRYFIAGVLGDWARAINRRCLMSVFGEVVAFRACQFLGSWRGNHRHRQLSRREKDRYFYPN
jgi:glycosyltransferase involved in cell wall biosynthesis